MPRRLVLPAGVAEADDQDAVALLLDLAAFGPAAEEGQGLAPCLVTLAAK
ncbi:MAG TPA: hypothetical protein VIS51_12730 [Solirubrobacterales bacterium]